MISVEIIWVQADALRQHRLRVPAGSRLGEVLEAAIAAATLPGDVLTDRAIAVFGRLRGPEHPLVDGDRIELTGPLQVDPKVARERRVAHRRAALPRSRWRPQGR